MMESNQTLKEDLEHAKVENADIAELEQEMDDLLEDMDKKDDTISNLNQIIQELEVDQDKLQREVEELRSKAEQEGRNIEQQKSDETEKILLLTKSVEDKELLIQSLKDKCVTLEESGVRLEKSLHSKTKLLQQKEEQGTTYEGSISTVDVLQQEIALLKQENVTLRNYGPSHLTNSSIPMTALDLLLQTQKDAMESFRSTQNHMEYQMQNILQARDTAYSSDPTRKGEHPPMIQLTPSALTEESSMMSAPQQPTHHPRTGKSLLSPQWTQEHQNLFSSGNHHLNPKVNSNPPSSSTTILEEPPLHSNPSGITLSTAPSTESELTECTLSPKGSHSVWTEEESVPHTIPEVIEEPSNVIHLEYPKESSSHNPTAVPSPVKSKSKSKSTTLGGGRLPPRKSTHTHKRPKNFGRASTKNTHSTFAISQSSSSDSNSTTSRNRRRASKMKKNIRILFQKSKKDTPKIYARSDTDVSFDTKEVEWETF